MTPFGNAPTGGFCPQCGCSIPQHQAVGGGPTMPGTFTTGMGYGAPWTGFGGPGMGFGGFGGPGMGFGMQPGAFGPPWNPAWMNPWTSPTGLGWGLGGMRRWGGTYSPQFMMTGLPTDDEIVEMVYDAIDADPLIPFDADIDVDSDAGTVTLSGTVPTKEIKHAAGDDAWWIPGVDDVKNDLQVARRRPEGMARRAPGEEGQQPARATGVTRMGR